MSRLPDVLGENVRIGSRFLSSRAFFRDPVGYAADRPGALLSLGSPTGRAALLRDPDEIWRVLVTDARQFRQGKWKRRVRRYVGPTLNTLEGSEHRERRLLLQPALDRRRVEQLTGRMVLRAVAAQATWEPGQRLVLRNHLDPLSLLIAGEVLLGVDLESEADTLAEALGVVMANVPRLTPPLRGSRRSRALSTVRTAVRTILASVDPADESRVDLPALLVRGGVPRSIAAGELTAFLLAAVDEPPSGLAAAWYLLGRAPDAETRLHVELDDVLGAREFAATDEQRLPYTDAVLRESLRLLPPARYVDRCPVEDTEIAGVRVRAGTNLLISPLVTHHDPALFENPTVFRPERWLEEGETSTAARRGYLPFGAGPHTCAGEPLARLIMAVTLATIARRWRLRIDPEAPPPIPGRPPLMVTLERR